MNAIVNTGPNNLEWRELPLPEPGKGQARIRTAACGICATDLAMIAGWKRTHFPAIPGHEWAGRVDAIGPGEDRSLVGRFCVAENVLAGGGEVGFEHPGAYAEYFLTECRNLQLLPDDFPVAAATLIEPLAVAVRGWRRLRPDDLSAALVLGDGPLGLLVTLLLKRSGIGRIALVGGRENRLALGRAFGAATALNYHEIEGDLKESLRAAAGRDFPNIIEASGSAGAAEAAVALAAPRGNVLILGDYGGGRAAFAWNDILHRELRIVGSNAGAGAWPEAVRTAGSVAGELARLVTREIPARRFAEAFELVRGSADAVKVVLRWDLR